MLAFGVVSALVEARGSGRGQTVDAAMFEGAALLGTSTFVLMAMGLYDPSSPGTNLCDTGAPFNEVYETRDARHVAVGAIEPQFYLQLLKGLGLDAAALPKQMDAKSWPDMKRRFADIFRTKTRAEWESTFEGTDACVSPVLSRSKRPSTLTRAAAGVSLTRAAYCNRLPRHASVVHLPVSPAGPPCRVRTPTARWRVGALPATALQSCAPQAQSTDGGTMRTGRSPRSRSWRVWPPIQGTVYMLTYNKQPPGDTGSVRMSRFTGGVGCAQRREQ